MIELFSATYTFDDLDIISANIFNIIKNFKIVCLEGDLGAGKTTLCKKLLKYFDIKQHITSPTFTYCCTYKNQNNKKISHFDFYRLSCYQSVFDLNLHEEIEASDHNFIEWPNVFINFLDKPYCLIRLEGSSSVSRNIKLFLVK